MQRITRLLDGPPSRGRWRLRAALAIVLGAGALSAVQVCTSGNVRPSLHIRSTTDGVLRPGDMREISAHGFDGDRYYRAGFDSNGHLLEVYERDGQARPITAEVRNWIAEVSRLSVPPAPDFPPGPAGAEAGPAADARSDSGEDAAFAALLRVVAADTDVVARLGTPVALASDDFHGRIELDDGSAPDGEADVRYDLTGPIGSASVHVTAELERGSWRVERLAFEAAGR